MRLALVLLAALCLSNSVGAADKKKQPDITIIESKAARAGGIISVDGKVKNTSEKAIKSLVLLFDFMAPGKQVITTQRGGVDDEVLQPGQESSFRVELQDPVRAVEYRYNAEDGSGKELRVGNPGPRYIE